MTKNKKPNTQKIIKIAILFLLFAIIFIGLFLMLNKGTQQDENLEDKSSLVDRYSALIIGKNKDYVYLKVPINQVFTSEYYQDLVAFNSQINNPIYQNNRSPHSQFRLAKYNTLKDTLEYPNIFFDNAWCIENSNNCNLFTQSNEGIGYYDGKSFSIIKQELEDEIDLPFNQNVLIITPEEFISPEKALALNMLDLSTFKEDGKIKNSKHDLQKLYKKILEKDSLEELYSMLENDPKNKKLEQFEGGVFLQMHFYSTNNKEKIIVKADLIDRHIFILNLSDGSVIDITIDHNPDFVFCSAQISICNFLDIVNGKESVLNLEKDEILKYEINQENLNLIKKGFEKWPASKLDSSLCVNDNGRITTVFDSNSVCK